MSVVVVVLLALLAVVVAAAVVAGLQLRAGLSGLGAAISRAVERVRPLADELGDESAVTSAELRRLQASSQRLRPPRTGPRRRGR